MSVNGKQHALYRFFDAEDRLLYIGITMNPSRRFSQHASGKEWWHDIARVTLERFPDRESVLAAEKAAIISENPAFNICMNGKRPEETVVTDRIDGLVGRFFHSWREPEDSDSEYVTLVRGCVLEWQGQVVDQIDEELYLIETYSWLDGSAVGTQLARVSDMFTWTFYESALDMQVALPCGEHHDGGGRCRNPVEHFNDMRKHGLGIQFVCNSCVDRYPGYADYPEIKWKNGRVVVPS